MRGFVFFVICCVFGLLSGKASEAKQLATQKCQGSWKGIKLTEKQLLDVVERHRSWAEDYEKAREAKNKLREQELEKDPRRANLCGADLRGADLTDANLTQAIMTKVDLKRAILKGAILKGANLQDADLTKAILEKADLTETNLEGAELGGAQFLRAVLTKSDLNHANLRQAILRKANLTQANLEEADLTKADFREANLTETILKGATLTNAFYEPVGEKPPIIWTAATVLDLETLRYIDSPSALTRLRKGFENEGFLEQGREVTYAIKRSDVRKKWYGKEDLIKRWEIRDLASSNSPDTQSPASGLWTRIEAVFSLLFLEKTSGFGLYPGRPLKIVAGLLFFFGAIYFALLVHSNRRNQIWILQPHQHRESRGEYEETGVYRRRRIPRERWSGSLKGQRRLFRVALYFSCLSTFHIGWRELNIGSWINRMQARPYILHATGALRTVSGVQSIISVYLIALSVLTYFGRPFAQ